MEQNKKDCSGDGIDFSLLFVFGLQSLNGIMSWILHVINLLPRSGVARFDRVAWRWSHQKSNVVANAIKHASAPPPPPSSPGPGDKWRRNLDLNTRRNKF